MNAIAVTLHQMPASLLHANPRYRGRRRRIGDYPIEAGALETFNRVLVSLDLRRTPLDCDQLATAGRALVAEAGNDDVAICIRERMGQAATLDRMLADVDWRVAVPVAASAAQVRDYVHSEQDLIPDGLRRIGRLDDAIVIDAAWPLLAAEIADYLAFCHVRELETELGGDGHLSREQSLRAAVAEQRWIAHTREVGGRSYLGASIASSTGFRIC